MNKLIPPISGINAAGCKFTIDYRTKIIANLKMISGLCTEIETGSLQMTSMKMEASKSAPGVHVNEIVCSMAELNLAYSIPHTQADRREAKGKANI